MSITSPPNREPTAFELERSASEYEQLRQMLIEHDASFEADESVVARMMEQAGTTHPRILLSRLVDAAIWLDRQADQADNLRKRYDARKKRYQERSDKVRATIRQLFALLGVTAAEGEEGAADLRKGTPSVIADVDRLPPEYVRVTYAADKEAMRPKLLAGEVIEGAELSTPEPTLRIVPF